MSERTPTNIMVTIIDTDQMIPKVNEYMQKRGYSATTSAKTVCSHGFVETPRGLYALCSDGVGPTNPITKKEPYVVTFFAVVEGEPVGFDLRPVRFVKLRPNQLRALATDTKVNLAEFIRRWGRRLDSFYEYWRTTLEAAVVGKRGEDET